MAEKIAESPPGRDKGKQKPQSTNLGEFECDNMARN